MFVCSNKSHFVWINLNGFLNSLWAFYKFHQTIASIFVLVIKSEALVNGKLQIELHTLQYKVHHSNKLQN